MNYEDYQNASADMSRSDYPQLNWDAIFKKDNKKDKEDEDAKIKAYAQGSCTKTCKTSLS